MCIKCYTYSVPRKFQELCPIEVRSPLHGSSTKPFFFFVFSWTSRVLPTLPWKRNIQWCQKPKGFQSLAFLCRHRSAFSVADAYGGSGLVVVILHVRSCSLNGSCFLVCQNELRLVNFVPDSCRVYRAQSLFFTRGQLPSYYQTGQHHVNKHPNDHEGRFVIHDSSRNLP